jgi:small redox-active disulfide protein 2
MNTIRQVRVAGMAVGLVGLDDVLARAAEEGVGTDATGAARLLERIARENYIPEDARQAYAESLLREYRRFLGQELPPEPSAGLEVRVLGPGCPNCERLERLVKEVLAREGLDGDVGHVRDLDAIAAFGPLPTPALVINGRVVAAGRVPSEQQLREWLRQGAAGAER